MKILFKALFAGAALFTSMSCFCLNKSSDISEDGKPPTIKVLVSQGQDTALIEITGAYFVYDGLNKTELDAASIGKRDTVVIEKFGLKWGDPFPGTHHLRLVPANSSTSALVNGIQYKGCIDVIHSDSKLLVINEIDVENYLKSILSSEPFENLDQEVLNAIAITARTDAYDKIEKNKSRLWAVDADAVKYSGRAGVKTSSRMGEAVKKTAFASMTFKGLPFPATWTENCAGKTVDMGSLLRKKIEVPNGTYAPYAASEREKNKWSVSLTESRLSEIIGLPSIHSIDLYLVPGSTKVYGLKLSSSEKEVEIDFIGFQKLLGKDQILSSDFTVQKKGKDVVFSGYGRGLGVGLCLFSAERLAKKGKTAAEILTIFFPETVLQHTKIKS